MTDPSASAPPSRTRVFFRRSASTLLLWAVVATVFASRLSWAYFGLITALIVIATIEYFRMLGRAGVPAFPRFGLFCSLAYSAALGEALLLTGKAPEGLDALALALVTIGSFTLQLRQPMDGIRSLMAVASNLLGFVYITVMFHYASRLLFVPHAALVNPGHITGQGALLLLWLVTVTKFTDMGAYITGSLIGRHKMIPHVSPAKTWEGFGGAMVFALLGGLGLALAFPRHLGILGSLPQVALLALVLAVLAVIGDLAESIIKRALAAKDSGRMLPGIGGSFDLIDSLCFTAPLLYLYLEWIMPHVP
ncbi:MAG TPA: phosphatidate cytidylyltransferase [Luteolibacter sp.]|nr:phosphatidate cytidylyltransferase [Luteolibacter sp.]